MIGMQNEDAPHGARQHGVDLVFLARHREAHMQKVGRVIELVLRIDEGLPDRVFVGHGGDGRHLGDHAHARHLALLGILDIDGVVIEGGERADHAHHDRHRMRVAPEPGVEPRHLLMHHRVLGDAVLEVRKLSRRREFAVEQQVAGLKEGAVLGELVDRIAAIEQDALVAVDEGDLRLAARRGCEARVVGEAPGVLVEGIDVDLRRAPTCPCGSAGRTVRRRSRQMPRQRPTRGGFLRRSSKDSSNHPDGDGSPTNAGTWLWLRPWRTCFCSAT